MSLERAFGSKVYRVGATPQKLENDNDALDHEGVAYEQVGDRGPGNLVLPDATELRRQSKREVVP